ncbi:MAG: tRNA (adenosine(37)-N6)-dimethylallyltransferase MiaA [Bacteroidota bacterium]|nr:tRNA (adenosine(37)-N6)-dimethylallyltransferase MiaA [Bacteroidota bacterium]MDP4241872.1 tRNA (adenosine(37)-N6)-dimethylallyltransferase MiaA [Bacteroidota bacterium]MDP4288940.1 tRNA (adenosine(37)-N6)-dimethylallyltransferase MiaA [Bacteroidota bacterium]
MTYLRTILVVTGPTAAGKTDFALRIAEADPLVEIINADAFLLYRGFDIGTAKPDKDTLSRIPHHLIDFLDPHDHFSAAEYSRLGREAIRDIMSRGKTPIVVGGTGLYIDALFDGIISVEPLNGKLDAARDRTRSEIEEYGFEEMHQRLRGVDPVLFDQILREMNPIRLQRAWEHFYATGEPLGVARERKPEPFEYEPEFHVIDHPRPEIWHRIEVRVDRMIARGWPIEAERLMRRGVTREAYGMRAIGYREMFDVVEGLLSLQEARERIVIRTRQYAKRQVTWMKKYRQIEPVLA